ncbi:DUF6221 family protein [Streptomyces sp. NPDC056112]|uniref:DUF6221 family protein n=1 Tax=Streptomyces sp. NPDC056112 TaxID=3345715 RepID=UPI0035DE0188
MNDQPTARSGDILVFLDMAISLREERARALGGGKIEVKSYGPGVVSLEGAIHLDGGALHEDEIAHIVLHDPESVLRLCAAARKVIAAHPVTRDVIAVQPDGNHGFGCIVCHTEDLLTIGDGWCDTLLALAEGYGWTEGVTA